MDTTFVRMMAAYAVWMNARLLACCATLPEAERRRDLGAFFKSVHGTLDHLIYGDIAWLGRFTGSPMPHAALGEIGHAGWDELCATRHDVDRRMIAWSEGVDTGWLAEPMTYTSSVDRRTRTLPRWVLVTHMFNHGTHHRGQLTTLLKQLGIDPGPTDLPWLPGLYDGSLTVSGAQK